MRGQSIKPYDLNYAPTKWAERAFEHKFQRRSLLFPDFLSSASAFFPSLSISRQPPLYERIEQAMINRAILINIKYTGLKILLLEMISRDIAKKIKKARKTANV